MFGVSESTRRGFPATYYISILFGLFYEADLYLPTCQRPDSHHLLQG